MFVSALDMLYETLGVDATLTIGTESIDVTVIDKTAGVELQIERGGLFTVLPAAAMRVSDLGELATSTVLDARISFNDRIWTITDYQERPIPTGSGELLLILAAGGESE